MVELTVMLPGFGFAGAVTPIEKVPCPLLIVQPLGTDQEYEAPE